MLHWFQKTCWPWFFVFQLFPISSTMDSSSTTTHIRGTKLTNPIVTEMGKSWNPEKLGDTFSSIGSKVYLRRGKWRGGERFESGSDNHSRWRRTSLGGRVCIKSSPHSVTHTDTFYVFSVTSWGVVFEVPVEGTELSLPWQTRLSKDTVMSPYTITRPRSPPLGLVVNQSES